MTLGDSFYAKFDNAMCPSARSVSRMMLSLGRHGGTALVILTLSAGAPLAAQRTVPEPAFASPDADVASATARARAFIADTMARVGAPGAQIAVMRHGRIIWSEGFGFADIEQGVRVTPLTRFRIGSVSKSLSSALLGKLVQQRKLDLDAPVQRYVPSFPTKRWPITTRQVAGHLAGIRHYDREEELFVAQHVPDVRSSLSVFANDSLRNKPGTTFLYSSYGWNLISAVLEAAGGEPYLTLMQREVLDAADLRHTVADQVDSIIPWRARWYTRGPSTGADCDTLSRRGCARGGIVNARFTDNSYKWAGGGFLSTTEDLVTFGDALLHGRLLDSAIVQLLWTSQRTTDGKETGYGMGWAISRDRAGRQVVSHSGGSVGGTANLVIYPKEDMIVAVLVNSDSTFIGAIRTIAEFFLDR